MKKLKETVTIPTIEALADAPASLSELSDGALKQVLLEKYKPENYAYEVIEVVGMTLGGALHEVARIVLKGKRTDGTFYTYPITLCSHGERSGCSILNAVQAMKQAQVVAEVSAEFAEETISEPQVFDDAYPLILERLIVAFYNDEWIGVEGDSFYLQHAMKLLAVPMREANRYCETLVARGVVGRNGNVFFPSRDSLKLPKRKLGVVRLKQEYTDFEVDLYGPESGADPQEYYLKAVTRGRVYAELYHPLLKPLSDDGTLALEDRATFEGWLRSNYRELLGPFQLEGPPAKWQWTDVVENFVPVKRDPKVHGNLFSSDFGYWHCTWCGQSGDDYQSPSNYPCEVKNA